MPDPTLIIAGNPGAIEMPIRTVWRKTGGYSYERRWWGPADAVRALQANPNFLSAFVSATEIQFDQREGSPIGILSIQNTGVIGEPGDDIATETVTISFKDEPFPINQNPTFLNDIDGLDDSEIQAIEALLQDKGPNPFNSGAEDKLRRYYDLRIRGVDNYRAKLPIVTWSRIVGSSYPAELDLANVGAIYSTGDLADSIGAPVLFDIPTGNVGIETGGAFTAGWLKDGSADYTGDGKLQLILTAEYGLWADDLYEFIT